MALVYSALFSSQIDCVKTALRFFEISVLVAYITVFTYEFDGLTPDSSHSEFSTKWKKKGSSLQCTFQFPDWLRKNGVAIFWKSSVLVAYITVFTYAFAGLTPDSSHSEFISDEINLYFRSKKLFLISFLQFYILKNSKGIKNIFKVW